MECVLMPFLTEDLSKRAVRAQITMEKGTKPRKVRRDGFCPR